MAGLGGGGEECMVTAGRHWAEATHGTALKVMPDLDGAFRGRKGMKDLENVRVRRRARIYGLQQGRNF
jgi:hypothetical protein